MVEAAVSSLQHQERGETPSRMRADLSARISSSSSSIIEVEMTLWRLKLGEEVEERINPVTPELHLPEETDRLTAGLEEVLHDVVKEVEGSMYCRGRMDVLCWRCFDGGDRIDLKITCGRS